MHKAYENVARSHYADARGVLLNMRLNDSLTAAAYKTGHVEEDTRAPHTVFRGGFGGFATASAEQRVIENEPTAVRHISFGLPAAKKADKKADRLSDTDDRVMQMFVDESDSSEDEDDEEPIMPPIGLLSLDTNGELP